jgi:hypothetical protein
VLLRGEPEWSGQSHLLRVREGVAAVHHHLRAKDLGSARHERDGHARPIVRLEAELSSWLECDRAACRLRRHRAGVGGGVNVRETRTSRLT